MKTLLLAFLLSGPFMTPAGQDPKMASENPWEVPCGYNEVYRATYYYQYPGGPECGLRYQYCYSTPPYQEGCTTSYYDVWYAGCYCP